VGALDVQSILPNAFAEDDVAILLTIADQLAVALQNARLFDQTARQARRESLVFDITSKIRASADADSMLRTAITELRSALGVSRAAVRMQAPDQPTQPTGNQTSPGGTVAQPAAGIARSARRGTVPLSGNGHGNGGQGAKGATRAAGETGPSGSGV
jgi:GAF domain-containing protein